MRAAIYARVSTANNGQSPEMQLRELREYCERRGWSVAGEYVDDHFLFGTKRRSHVVLTKFFQDQSKDAARGRR